MGGLPFTEWKREGLGSGGWGRDDWRQCWGWITNDSLLVPFSADILPSSTWKSTFLFRKEVPCFKKVSWFFFFSLPCLFTKACSSFVSYFIFFQTATFSSSSSFFTAAHSLQEANWSNIKSKLLVCSTDIHGGNVHNGQTGGLLRPVFEHCLTPLSCVSLQEGKKIIQKNVSIWFAP